MRNLALIAASLLLWPSTVSANAQTPDQLKDLRAQLIGNKFLVRGFSDDLITTFHWNGTELSYSDPKLHTIGVLKPKSVELKANTLTISGERTTLVRDKNGALGLSGGAKAVLIVDLQGAAALQSLIPLKSELFFSSIQEGVAALPPGRRLPPPSSPQEAVEPSPPPTPRSCSASGQTLQRPTVLKTVDAEYSEEAKQSRFSGIVTVVITVGEDGNPHDIWISRSAGLGLDEKAGQAVAQYKFHPATCDEKPVKSTLYVDVNFVVVS